MTPPTKIQEAIQLLAQAELNAGRASQVLRDAQENDREAQVNLRTAREQYELVINEEIAREMRAIEARSAPSTSETAEDQPRAPLWTPSED